ncbi:MAG: peptidoglycan-binding protein [Algoriphagus sp. 32-45-6]|nr:MAG: peptidoglycan-binding protein [Algoriphagus sp. 32-45-6]
MRPVYLFLLVAFGFLPLGTQAEVLIAGDSIGVERVGDKTFILHKVSPQETLFAISRRYQISVGEIQNANEVLKQGLKIGQTIRIPFVAKSALPEGVQLHKVSPGETLFSISKKYGVTVDSLKKWNNLLGNDLSVGQSITVKDLAASPSLAVAEKPSEPAVVEQPKVTPVKDTKAPVKEQHKPVDKTEEEPKKVTETPKPTSKPSNSAPAVNSAPIAPGDWRSHTVQSGETLFSLASRYETSVEDLIQWNGLTSNNLRSGQVLKVGRGAPAPSTVPVIGTPKVASSPGEMSSEQAYENTSGGFKNMKETGLAEVIEGTGTHKKYLVLHRTAPVGSIIRVENEENDMTIFARVVGTLPETGDNSKLVVKLSQAAYDQLKAVNSRFPVEILY